MKGTAINMSNINKKELHDIFQGIYNKNEEKFNLFYEKYNKLVYSIAFSILKNKENSEDVVQNVYTKIWNMDKNKLPKECEASWIYSLTKNETLNYIRSKKQEINIEEIYYLSVEDDEISKIIEKDKFNKIISKLNKQEQEIVSLKILAQFTFKEISQMLDMPIATVQWKYYKALHSLKLLLTNLCVFIITIGIFLTKNYKNILHKYKGEQNQATEMNNSTQEEIMNKEEYDNIAESNENSGSITDGILDSEVTEGIIEEEMPYNLSANDYFILSLSGIFLILTIVFLAIWFKNKRKKK